MGKMVEYVAKDKKIFIGLEDSKSTWKLCVRADNMVIHEVSMPAQYTVLHKYLQQRFPQCAITIMYEAGFRGFSLYDLLAADGYTCIVTPPHTVTQEKTSRVKCDKIDARRLAQNLEANDFKACHVPDKTLREDRQISRTLNQVQKDLKRYKNRVRRFLDCTGYAESFKTGSWYDADYQKLKDFKMPAAHLRLSLQIYLRQLDLLWKMENELMAKMRELSRTERYQPLFKLFTTAPGVGMLTAMRLLLEWGTDMKRFPSSKQLASFTGLTPSEYSTGDTIRRGHITRLSNRSIRAVLVEAAWVAYRHDPVLLHKFQAIWSRTSSKKKAIVAVARTLAIRLRAVALTGQPYQIGLIK
jgi:transposase